MNPLSLVLATLLVFLSLVLFAGGLGPLMMIGVVYDQFHAPRMAFYATAVAYLGLWLGGIILCIVRFRALWRMVATSMDRPNRAGDYFVVSGHLTVVVAAADWLGFRTGILWDFVYLWLMLAAVLYSIALAHLAMLKPTEKSAGPSELSHVP